MKLKKTWFFIMTLAILQMSCECPTDIDTPTIIKPTIFANVLFINAMPEMNLNKLYVLSSSKIIEGIDTVSYTDSLKRTFLNKEYRPVGVMVGGKKNILRLAKTEADTLRLLFNCVLNIEKDKYYTFVAYGDEASVQSIIVNDNLTNPKEENIYIRCFNVSPKAPVMHITVSTEKYSSSVSLASGEYSEIANSPLGDYTINITSADSTIKNYQLDNVKFTPGRINNVIFRGNYSGATVNIREAIVVTGDYPF